jgi:hypothetical protein
VDRIEFEWDAAKAEKNLRKHGVAFEDATRVFADPGVIFEVDRELEGEQRLHAIGIVRSRIALTVVHTTVEEVGFERVRIISAREATPGERRRYEQQNG